MKKLLFLFTLLFSSPLLNAQELLPPLEMVDSIYALKKVVPLYKITKENQPASYLMGTIHIVPSKYDPSIEILKPYIAETQEMYLEVANLSDIKPEYYLRGKKEKEFLSFFSVEQKDSIFDFAEKHCKITKGMLKINSTKFKPMIVEQLLLSPFSSGDYSYDIALFNYANENHMPVNGMEKIEDQLKALSTQDSASTNRSIMENIRHPEKVTALYQKMLYHYFSGNTAALEQIISDQYTDKNFISNILDQRNIKWMKKLKKDLKKKSYFIAVGAGHLDGKNGLINLLENEGYTITRIEL